VIAAPVRYVRAATLEEAFEALVEPDAKLLAGGQSLIPILKLRVIRPSVLVDIGGLDSSGIRRGDEGMSVGALTTWAELGEETALREPALAAIPDCAARIGDLQIRNRGTVGGSLAHADPASDMPAVVLALGASLRLVSRDGGRSVAAADFFVGPFTTALRPGEILREVVFPEAPAGSGSAYAKVEHPASGFALAGAAALVRPDGTQTVAVTGIGASALLLPDGTDPHEALAAAEVYGDDLAPAEYRCRLAEVVVARALERARERAS
jgi:aerobic carbon-monoxide dehydrogenase medium subunit